MSILGVEASWPLLVAGGAVFLAALLVGVLNWRWSVYGLLLYLPFSGIPILAAYPDTEVPVLLKDFLFVIPAYVGFLACFGRRFRHIWFAAAPTVLFATLGLLVAAQAFNPALPRGLVGAIGVKVWLFYIPLYFLAYHFVRDRRDLFRLLTLVSVAAVVPALVGVFQAGLFRGDHDSWVSFLEGIYGDAAGPATQGFTQFDLPGGGIIRRVPSTFSSWTQYFNFVATMVAVTYAWWRGALSGRRAGLLGAGVCLLMVTATLLTGARAAFLLVPVLLALILALQQGARRPSPRALAAPVGVVLAFAAVFAVVSPSLLAQVFTKVGLEFGTTFFESFGKAVEITWSGLGTGIDTIASRYAYSSTALFPAVGGIWFESWWVKVVLELGIPGLVVVAALFATILARGFRQHRSVADPRLAAVSAAILAFLAVNVVAAATKPYLDYDPVNVYFWFLAGVLAKIPVLDATEAAGGLPGEGRPGASRSRFAFSASRR